MKLKTKLRLKFYLSLAALVLLTAFTGIIFEYVVFLAWQHRIGLPVVPYREFMAMAFILLVMSITDIVLFFRLILNRKYW